MSISSPDTSGRGSRASAANPLANLINHFLSPLQTSQGQINSQDGGRGAVVNSADMSTLGSRSGAGAAERAITSISTSTQQTTTTASTSIGTSQTTHSPTVTRSSNTNMTAGSAIGAGARSSVVRGQVTSPSPPSSEYNTPHHLSDSPEYDDDDDDDDDDDIIDEDDDTAADIDDEEYEHMDEDDLELRRRPKARASVLPAELILAIFNHLDTTEDIRSSLLVCKDWARCAVELLWYRLTIQSPFVLLRFMKTLRRPEASLTFPYGKFVRRLNLAGVADSMTDQILATLGDACSELERLTLSSCRRLTDQGLVPLINANHNLVAIDLSHVDLLTDGTIKALAESCHKLQGLNLTGCRLITDESIILVAQKCNYLRRVNLLECSLISDDAVEAISTNCQNLMELDLQGCTQIRDKSVTTALNRLPLLREFRVGLNTHIAEEAFLPFPTDGSVQFDALRILDLTGCAEITDAAVLRIVSFAPRLRNLVLAKCINITDHSLMYITKLGRSLHYLHLGHCSLITDVGVAQLVRHCTRIRYIDLACCVQLTNSAVTELAALPKLRRIGLVKCQNITDVAIHALVQRRTSGIENSLERVHLSYCANLTISAIHDLLNSCPRLTHLSLTGVPAFIRADITQFCRAPPPEFNQHQQSVFCVFSGQGVNRLRQHLTKLALEHQNFARQQYHQHQNQ
ncbi:hypothetical protein V1511DRAFT_472858, partial [Dipodascopsis uninucleata]